MMTKKCEPYRDEFDGTWTYVTLGGTLSVGHKSENAARASIKRHVQSSERWARYWAKRAKRRTVRNINAALRAAGFEERVTYNRTHDYFYFYGGDSSAWFSSSVGVSYASGIAMTDAWWVAERGRLAAGTGRGKQGLEAFARSVYRAAAVEAERRGGSAS